MLIRPTYWSAVLLAALIVLSFVACESEPIDPDDPPAFMLSGTLTVDGQEFDLAEWEQGPFTYSRLGEGFTMGMAKDNVGFFNLFIEDVAQAELVATHIVGDSTSGGGLLNVSIDGTPQVGNLERGTMVISKNEAFQNPLPTTEIRLISGSFSGEGSTTTGANFTFSGAFQHAQATFQ